MSNFLVLLGDFYHPADRVGSFLAPLLEEAPVRLTVLTDPAAFPWDTLDEWDGLLIARDALLAEDGRRTDRLWCPPERQSRLSAFVQEGGGLLAVHSGIAQYPAGEAYRRLTKGVFTHHPPGALPLTVHPLNLRHPVMDGVGEWTTEDELYCVQRDPDAPEPLAELVSSEHGSSPAVWAHEAGRGRVCVLTPGHTEATWTHPSMRRLLYNALSWTARTSRIQEE
ncbi:hypothetical protein J31TS4_25180 [Paenibacillus sp. J31TS4]|uniref:ThuA domain-containing protein n=1 Tax=Paenibacillus sp. J31TS4 TaxID=2807195 RepID=UPI001B006D34|nr:ThuA domain-containing protein [Paenibacillus sp. J31TS4]GIP39238.1 hypothetical protein J31TS4_25180 [Paenibacillus sp. J31TS4]